MATCSPRFSRLAEGLVEWLPCLPCLFLRAALPLYILGALSALLCGAFLPGRLAFLHDRLMRMARLQIVLAGIALLTLAATPSLLMPDRPLATFRLAVALCLLPLLQTPAWILTALCLLRSARAWLGNGPPRLRKG